MTEKEYCQIEKCILDAAQRNDRRLEVLLYEAATHLSVEQFVALTDKVIDILSNAIEEIRQQTDKIAKVKV